MNAKKMIMAGTVAATITLGGGLWTENTGAAASGRPAAVQAAAAAAALQSPAERKKDDFLELLGKSSDEEVYEALYAGKSLADIAQEAGGGVQSVIDLQVAELTEQLNARLADGQLSAEAYEAQIAELPEIVERSVYGKLS